MFFSYKNKSENNSCLVYDNIMQNTFVANLEFGQFLCVPWVTVYPIIPWYFDLELKNYATLKDNCVNMMLSKTRWKNTK